MIDVVYRDHQIVFVMNDLLFGSVEKNHEAFWILGTVCHFIAGFLR